MNKFLIRNLERLENRMRQRRMETGEHLIPDNREHVYYVERSGLIRLAAYWIYFDQHPTLPSLFAWFGLVDGTEKYSYVSTD